MKTRCSPYHRPWIWLIRRTTITSLLVLVVCFLFNNGLTNITELVVVVGLVCAIVVLTLGTIADILVAGFCEWAKAMGAGLGELVSAMRKRS